MGQFCARLALLASAAVMLMSGTAQGSITRIGGPTDLFNEPNVFVKFDAAFDSVHRVYLAVWGTQGAGPTKGLFLSEAGTPIGGPFAISDHSDGSLQAGWARVVFSAQEGKFLVSYTKILAANVHGKAARFVTYSASGPLLSAEITIASGYGHPGTESGLAYSVPARTFLVTWWTYYGPTVKPVTFVTAINPSGAIQSPQIPGLNGWGTPITNPNDGQADPEIACDPVTRHCLVVGFSWGTFYGGNAPPPAVWGRYIDDATGAPLGPDSFYLPVFGYIDSPTVSFGAGKFLVAYTGNGQVLGNIASGAAVDVTSFSPYYGLRVSSPATDGHDCCGGYVYPGDGGGFRYPSLSYNSSTNTTLLAASGYLGYPVAQEIDASGTPIAGALDFIPDPGPNYDTRTQYTIPIANSVTPGFLYLDNHFFVTMRVSRYGVGASTPPPPAAPTCAPTVSTTSINSWSGAYTFAVDVNVPSTCSWTTSSNAAWLQIGNNASGTGPATVSLAVLRNVSSSPRTGSVVIAGNTVTVTQAGFNAASTHDLDGDGFSDIVWQNQATGGVARWSIRGGTVVSSTGMPGVSDTTWKIMATGDLSGDGYADLVWQRTDGSLAVWFMTPGGIVGGGLPSVDPHWKVRAAGDLNGDGKADLVFQHDTEGWVAAWFMNGVNLAGSSVLSIPRVPDLNWLIVGAGDLSGDGRADIIWQNQATGLIVPWVMNGSQVVTPGFISMSVADLNWKILGVGDVDGNGLADFIWENTISGQVSVWFLSGFTVTGGSPIYSNGVPASVNPAWIIVGPG